MRRFKKFGWVLALVGALGLSGCGYNRFQSGDEDVKAAWAEVVNQYQRRSDLIPNLVQTVKGFASHEEKIFAEVAEARSRIGSVQVTPDKLGDQAAMDRFASAQGGLQSALSRLLVITEQYPNLKADAQFRDLQAQLEGTENRITVARNRYIETVREYNLLVRQFPSNLTAKIFGYPAKAQFNVSNEAAISAPPKVDFGAPAQP